MPGEVPLPLSEPWPGKVPEPGTEPAPGKVPVPGNDPLPGDDPPPGGAGGTLIGMSPPVTCPRPPETCTLAPSVLPSDKPPSIWMPRGRDSLTATLVLPAVNPRVFSAGASGTTAATSPTTDCTADNTGARTGPSNGACTAVSNGAAVDATVFTTDAAVTVTSFATICTAGNTALTAGSRSGACATTRPSKPPAGHRRSSRVSRKSVVRGERLIGKRRKRTGKNPERSVDFVTAEKIERMRRTARIGNLPLRLQEPKMRSVPAWRPKEKHCTIMGESRPSYRLWSDGKSLHGPRQAHPEAGLRHLKIYTGSIKGICQPLPPKYSIKSSPACAARRLAKARTTSAADRVLNTSSLVSQPRRATSTP